MTNYDTNQASISDKPDSLYTEWSETGPTKISCHDLHWQMTWACVVLANTMIQLLFVCHESIKLDVMGPSLVSYYSTTGNGTQSFSY